MLVHTCNRCSASLFHADMSDGSCPFCGNDDMEPP
ncbi:hypothetical protein Aeh1ORF275c [Aeromonas phage Aeh1]|uniref:Uncharacterized protein n=1 Tax=Aeromonas phage Aeh1 TaxID=2880362 RepID=Q76YF5_9CAUD|nr:hypothetical protein Aeh1p290 [Aeromonas phage Aeh1]AAQ17940.1 hypothetical protein Aeh1ORF275c [Aeromonas phage Aeh1]